MVLYPVKTMIRLLTALALISFTTGRLIAAPTGPTLQLGYDDGKPLDNPLNKFMYFVPLISPSFHATCEFEFIGEGLQQNVFDHADCIRKHEKELKAGNPRPLKHGWLQIPVSSAR